MNKIRGFDKRLIWPILLVVVSYLVLFLAWDNMSFSEQDISGNIILNTDNVYHSGEILSGKLKIEVNQGELIPADAKIVIEQDGISEEFLLSDLIEMNAEGNYYVQEKNLQGSGRGFGFEGSLIERPLVDFILILTRTEEIVDENVDGGSEEVVEENENSEEVAPVEGTPEETETPTENTEGQASVEESVESSEESSPSESSDSSITGSAIVEDETEVSGSVRKGDNFEYNLDGRSVRLKEGSVFSDGEELQESEIDLDERNDKVIVSTNYEIERKGFGAEFLGKKIQSESINLEDLNILIVKDGDLKVQLIFGEEVLSEVDKNIVVIENKTNVTGNVTIETTSYRPVINQPVKWQKKIKGVAGEVENAKIELPKEAENIEIKTGEDVAIAEKAKEDFNNNVENLNKEEVVQSPSITGNAVIRIETKKKSTFLSRFLRAMRYVVTGNVVADIQENEEGKVLDLSSVSSIEGEEEIIIEYVTQGPVATETEEENGKEIVVSAPDELGLKDVLAYTLIDEEKGISVEESYKMKLYHYLENGEKESVDFVAEDLDENGIVDYVEWNVPHLSNQTYELIFISKADRLNENKEFIQDVYYFVKEQDNITTIINNGEYLRVTFEELLTNKNDITIYARQLEENSKIEVYAENSSELLAEFSNFIS